MELDMDPVLACEWEARSTLRCFKGNMQIRFKATKEDLPFPLGMAKRRYVDAPPAPQKIFLGLRRSGIYHSMRREKFYRFPLIRTP